MNTEIESARDDLAYMRALVSGGGQFQAAAGELFVWAGLLYGLQCVGHWLDLVGAVDLPALGMLALGFGPTIVFLVVLAWVLWKDRKNAPQGVAARALSAAFGGAGLANLVMVFVFGYVSALEQNFIIWLLYPIMVCVVQGAAWFITFVVRRRLWLGLVSLGWFATAIAMALTIRRPEFVLIMGAACFLLMALPGWAMMRSALKAA